MRPPVLALLAAPATLLLNGCIDHVNLGQVLTARRDIEVGKAEMVRVEVRLGAGELKLTGGASKLMEAQFRANEKVMPDARYSETGFRGNLVIEQPSLKGPGLDANSWEVRLNDKVPMDVQVKLGAGESKLDLGSLTLRSVQVHIGVGELRLDLRGKPARNYDVEVHGGVGEARIYLPKDVGVLANVKGGIGEISAPGLRKRGNDYENELYSTAPVKIRLDVKGGVGSIQVGFPVEESFDNVLCNGEKPEWTSDKTTRRRAVAASHRILLLL
ncbi:MAG: hypothetical protein FJW40_23700, partial [Acidobacteria bacterium]|nr:hypothetical protein [Acidobacteriota bacterium]